MADHSWKKGMMFESEDTDILKHDALRESWESIPPVDEKELENDPLIRLRAHHTIPNHKFSFNC